MIIEPRGNNAYGFKLYGTGRFQKLYSSKYGYYLITHGRRVYLDWCQILSLPLGYEDEEGKLCFVGYFDYDTKLYIEIHPDGELARTWREI